MDCIILPYDCIKFCLSFEVETISDLLNSWQLYNLVSQKCKPPDHSLISVSLNCSYIESIKYKNSNESNASSNSNNTNEASSEREFLKNSKKIHHLRKSNETYVNSNSWNESIVGLANKLEESLDSQVQIDEAYSIFCDTLFSEIDSNLQINYCTKAGRKRYKYYKPYWSNDLTKVWKDMRDAEKEAYIQSKEN